MMMEDIYMVLESIQNCISFVYIYNALICLYETSHGNRTNQAYCSAITR